MQRQLRPPGRRRFAYAMLLCLALASGCADMTKSSLLVQPKHCGSFALDGSTDPIQGLIEKLRDHAPAAMKDQGFTDVDFEPDDNRQWAVVKFKSTTFYHWVLGIQFVRAPNESSARANAWIRTFGLGSGSEISPTELQKILPMLRLALESAAKGNSAHVGAK